MNEPAKTKVDAEDWLKATSVELCKVADHFIALRKDAERVDAAAVEIMDSTAKLEQENTALQARVKRLEEVGDQMAAWLNCERNLGNDTYTAHLWKQAKESKP